MEFGKSVSRTILAGAFAALCSIYSPSAQAAEKTAELDLQAQIDAAAARGGGTVRVPAGVYEVKPIVLKSNTTLEFAEGAMLLASTNLADYSEIPEKRCVIYAENATNVAVVGKGVINGRGGVFKAKKAPLEVAVHDRPYMMIFSRCRNLRLEGFHFRESAAWGIHLRNCDGVVVRGVSCISHANRNNDGIDVESSNVLIEDCDLDAGDDAVVLKTESDKSFQVTNVVVRNCRLASSCNAFKFGTGSYNTFRDVTLENCRLERPKWYSAGSMRYYARNFVPTLYEGNAVCGLSAIELAVVDGGRLENVTLRNLEIDGYLSAIHIRHHHRHEPTSGKIDTYLRNVLIENVKGSVDGRLASAITGVPPTDGAAARRPRDITLRNIHLTVLGGGTEADAQRAVPEKDGAYPACWMYDKKPLPAYGFYVRHADNIKFENVVITPRSPDAREPFVFDDCAGCDCGQVR